MKKTDAFLRRVAGNITETRKSLGFSQCEFAKRIGADVSNYCKIEMGKSGITLRMLHKISSAMRVDPSVLLR